jgi:hypothetical protein
MSSSGSPRIFVGAVRLWALHRSGRTSPI